MRLSYSDEQILVGIKARDNLVLIYIYSEYWEKAINYVARNSGCKNEAKDVFQDTIINVYKEVQKKDFILKKSFDIYFITVLKNTWRCAVKFKNKQKHTDDFPEDILNIETDFFDEYKKEQIRKLTLEQFRLLGEKCQKVLDMYYFQKKAMAEIAFQMEYKNEQIAKNKKHRCLEHLKDLIKNQTIYKTLANE